MYIDEWECSVPPAVIGADAYSDTGVIDGCIIFPQANQAWRKKHSLTNTFFVC